MNQNQKHLFVLLRDRLLSALQEPEQAYLRTMLSILQSDKDMAITQTYHEGHEAFMVKAQAMKEAQGLVASATRQLREVDEVLGQRQERIAELERSIDSFRTQVTLLSARQGGVKELQERAEKAERQVRELQLKYQPDDFVDVWCYKAAGHENGSFPPVPPFQPRRVKFQIPRSLREEILHSWRIGRTVVAVKLLRVETGIGLLDAKLTLEDSGGVLPTDLTEAVNQLHRAGRALTSPSDNSPEPGVQIVPPIR